MGFEWSKHIAAYFDTAASAYARSIDPVFKPLAQSLAGAAVISATDVVLDIGTGTGLLAEAASQYTSQVIAIDFSWQMLQIAQQRLLNGTICGNIHTLPLATASIDLVLASFAFNSTDPSTGFAEAHRVLQHSGRLIMQEWAETDSISDLISDLFAEYMVDEPPPHLEALRTQMEQPIPWDDLESIEGLEDMLIKTGFQSVDVQYISPEIALPNAETFLRYKLAWPIRAAELAAMPEELRAICLDDMRENIAPYINRHTGQFIWQPNIVRLNALR